MPASARATGTPSAAATVLHRRDPEDPNIVYAQSQEGALQRLDLRTGQSVSIRRGRRIGRDRLSTRRRRARAGAAAGTASAGAGSSRGQGARGRRPRWPGAGGRWQWDSPVIVSPHSARRLYFAGERLYRSDDRGDTWVAVSPDLTRQLDAAKLPIMGKVWPPDSVAFNQATSS